MKTSKELLAIFLPGLYDGGAERTLLNLAEGMAAKGVRVDLVLSRAEGPYMSEVPDSVRVVDLQAPRVLLCLPALIRYLRREHPRAMLATLYANIVAVWARQITGIPVTLVLNEQNTLTSVARGEHDLRWRLYPELAKWFYPWADYVTAVSQGVADDLMKATGLTSKQVRVVYNPIVTSDLFEKSGRPLEHPWFRNGEPPVILAVGRLTGQKAFDVLIEAFAQVRRKQRARMIILGEGEQRSMLEALIGHLGLQADVELPGFVANPYAYMARAGLFVLSSRWEGLPTVLVEAMSLGTPVVATDCPSGPQEILAQGRYGQLVPVDEPECLALAIQASLEKHAPCPPQESWKPFELEYIADQYLSMLLGSSPRPSRMGQPDLPPQPVPRVLISGHLPPPMSGIGTYYQALLASSLPGHVSLQFIDTSSRRRPGAETGKWSLANLLSAVADCARFSQAVLVYRPQICHIATSVGLSFLKHSLCILAARAMGSRVLLHPHCSFHVLYERHGKPWQFFVRKMIGLCHGVVILSNEWKKLQEAIPGCRLYYVSNAIDLTSYARVGRDRIESQREGPCLHILYLGHLGQEKGSFDLLSAAKAVLKQEPGIVFDLVGLEQVRGDMERLQAKAAEAGFEQCIHVRPAVTGAEKMELFRAADLFVYPSYHEGMPMAVIEAMACGLPVVATRVGGLPELVCPGVNGLLVQAGRPDQLAEAILRLVRDPQTRYSMQIESFRRAQEDFDVEKLVLRLVDIYQSLLSPLQKRVTFRS